MKKLSELDHLIPVAHRQLALFALVDEVDSDLKAYRWYITRGGYVWARIDGRQVYLHRLILSRVVGRPLQKGEYGDHVEHNPLDNRRSMLRIASNTENLRNRSGKARGFSNPYVGVSFVSSKSRHRKPWKAYYKLDGKQITVGYYSTPEEAARERDEAIRPVYGEFGVYNEIAV